MKKWILIFLVNTGLLLNGTFREISFAAEKELIAEEGFEEWGAVTEEGTATAILLPVGFHTSKRADVKDNEVIVKRTGKGEIDQERHGGNYAAYISTKSWSQGLYLNKPVPVSPGMTYRISAWAKAVNGGFQLHVMGYPGWECLGHLETEDNEWKCHTLDVVPRKGHTNIIISLFTVAEGNSFYADDLSAYQMDIAPANLKEGIGKDRDTVSKPLKSVEITKPLLVPEVIKTLNTKYNIAIFYDAGFPNNSKGRKAEWYKTVLEEMGHHAKYLNLKEIIDEDVMNKTNFDVLIVPNGEYFPVQAELSVSGFMSAGGNIIIDDYAKMIAPFDGIQWPKPDPVWGPRVEGKWKDYNRRYLSRDFEILKRNPCSEYNAMIKNPGIKDLLGDFPDKGPYLGAIAYYSQGPSSELSSGEFSWRSPGFEDDMVVPLYKLADTNGVVKGNADFCLIRHHCLPKNGSTMIILGDAGQNFLNMDKGEISLKTLVGLFGKKLPEENNDKYYLAKIASKRALSDLCETFVDCFYNLNDLHLAYFYHQDINKSQAIKENMREVEKDLFEVIKKRNELYALFHKDKSDTCEMWESLNSDISLLSRKFHKFGLDIQENLIQNIHPPEDITINNNQKHIYFSGDTSFCQERGLGQLRIQLIEAKKIGLDAVGRYWSEIAAPLHKEFQIKTFHSPAGFVCYAGGGGQGLDVKTGKIIEGSYPLRSYGSTLFIDEGTMKKHLDDVACEVNILKDKEALFMYQLPNELQVAASQGIWWDWGSDALMHYLDYLRSKYGNIANLNKQWGANYSTFEQIQLLTKFPETQPEHANWEDWTKLREITLTTYLKGVYETIKKYDQGHPVIDREYHGDFVRCLIGLNYYELSRYVDYDGKHLIGEGLNDISTEWYKYKVANKPVYNTEWHGFLSKSDDQILLTKTLDKLIWKGLANGQVGWNFFVWNQPEIEEYASCMFVDDDGIPKYVAWELKHLIDVSRRIDHIILDGQQENGAVAFLFSDTNKRHSCDNSMNEALTGFDLMFRHSYLDREVLVEEEIRNNALKEYKVVIIPSQDYLPKDIIKKLLEFVKSGGTLAVTGEAGKYDEYGYQNNEILESAGVIMINSPKTPLIEDKDCRYFSPVSQKMKCLVPVLGNNIEIIRRYKSGEPAITRTKIDKGYVVVMAFPFGLDYYNHWKSKPKDSQVILAQILNGAGINQGIFCEDKDIEIKSWIYDKEKYLFIVNNNMDKEKEASISIKGGYDITDYLIGACVPNNIHTEATDFKIRLLPAEGRVFFLKKSDKRAFSERGINKDVIKVIETGKPGEPKQEPSVSEKKNSLKEETEGVFFQGWVWLTKDSVIEKDGFIFEMEDVGPKGYDLTIRHKGNESNALIIEGGSADFFLPDVILSVKFERIQRAAPIAVKITVVKKARIPEKPGCSFKKSIYLGKEAIILENSLIKVTVLPEIGGRIIEFMDKTDNFNQLNVVKENIIRSSNALSGPMRYGGYEENLGLHPGPFQNKKFEYEIIENSEEGISVKLTCTDIQSGCRLERIMSLKKQSRELALKIELHNILEQAKQFCIGIHPESNVGGIGDENDFFYIPTKEGLRKIQYRPGQSMQEIYPAEPWFAILDKKKKLALINDINLDQIDHLYFFMGDGEWAGIYNPEVIGKAKVLKPGEKIRMDLSWRLVKDMPDIDCYQKGIVATIATDKAVLKHDDNLKIKLILKVAEDSEIKLQLSVYEGNEKIALLFSESKKIGKDESFVYETSWNTKKNKDGDYFIKGEIHDPDGKHVACRKAIKLTGESFQEIMKNLEQLRKKLELLKDRYNDFNTREKESSLGAEIRTKIMRGYKASTEASVLCEEGAIEQAKEKLKEVENICE